MKHHFIDRYSDLKSPIHNLNTTLKLFITVAVILTTVTQSEIPVFKFLLIFVILLIIIYLSRVPLIFFFKNLLILLPFAIIGGLSVLFAKSGDVYFSIGGLKIFNNALMNFITILEKSIISVSTTILFVSTSRFDHILKSFQDLKIPSIIISLLSFIYRYVFFVIDEFMRTKMAIVSRSSRKPTLTTWSYMVSKAFSRSMERGEQIYLSMKARGYNGTIKTLNDERFTQTDSIKLIFCIFLLALIWKL